MAACDCCITDMSKSGEVTSIGCCWKLLAALPLVLALIVYLGPLVLDKWDSTHGYTAPLYDGVPEDFMDDFRLYDVDGNDCIDPTEFYELMIKVSSFL